MCSGTITDMEPHMKTILAINSTHRRVAFLVLLSFLAMC